MKLAVLAPLLLCLTAGPAPAAPADATHPAHYILFNAPPDQWADLFARVHTDFQSPPTSPVRGGVGAIFSYLHYSHEALQADLRRFMKLSADNDVPIVIQLDGENWWGGRPDLWNWWKMLAPPRRWAMSGP